MTLQPIRQATLSDTVVERLRTEIAEGRWAVDERIPPEQELMAQLGVARGTLREALRALQYSGMLEIRRGDGTFVRARSEMAGAVARSGATLGDVIEAQLLIEPTLARLAAERATAAHIEVIADAVRRRDGEQDDEAWLDADLAMHQAVADAAGNTVLAELYAALLPHKRAGMARAMRRGGLVRDGAAGHAELLDAIRLHDPDAAEASARANLEDTEIWDAETSAR